MVWTELISHKTGSCGGFLRTWNEPSVLWKAGDVLTSWTSISVSEKCRLHGDSCSFVPNGWMVNKNFVSYCLHLSLTCLTEGIQTFSGFIPTYSKIVTADLIRMRNTCRLLLPHTFIWLNFLCEVCEIHAHILLTSFTWTKGIRKALYSLVELRFYVAYSVKCLTLYLINIV
jgi:hypothetical protein